MNPDDGRVRALRSLRLFSRNHIHNRPGAAVRSVLKVVACVLAALLVVALGGYAWASFAASRQLSRIYTVHTVDFPIPSPLPEEEVRRLGLTPDSARLLARDRALERGRHLVESRYACMGCHGTALRVPMSEVVPYAAKMSDVEVEALWMYLQSLPAVASRK